MDMTNILTPPWPKSLAEFVVWCLAWDPKKRPTSIQCLQHEYFRDVEKYLPIREPIPSPPSSDESNNRYTSDFILQPTKWHNPQTKSQRSRHRYFQNSKATVLYQCPVPH